MTSEMLYGHTDQLSDYICLLSLGLLLPSEDVTGLWLL